MKIRLEPHDECHQSITARLRSGDAARKVEGQVLTLIPLRNRREGLVTRTAEGCREWTLPAGRTGYGWSEYLDQIVEGQPVGIDA